MSYEYNSSDVMDFLSAGGYDFKQIGEEVTFKYCPYCGGGQHRDKDTFSINLRTGAYCCLRGTCGVKGHFVQLARDFDYKLNFGEVKQFRSFPKGSFPKQIDRIAIDYLESRGISRAITEKYFVTGQKGSDKVITFPFYDENGELQLIKYRNTKFRKGADKAKEWFEKSCKPILFGMMQAKNYEKPLVITEGQIDSLTLAECGIENAVSVPGGCKNFNWYVYCSDFMRKFPKVIVFGDWEKGRMTLLDEIRSLMDVPVYEVDEKYYLGEKDANDILMKYGRTAVIQAVENARLSEIKAVRQLADVEKVDLLTLPRISTGIPGLDRVIGGMYFGQVILLTGKRGEGKSTFGSQLIVEALGQKYPCFIYSGELPDFHFKNWIDLQIAGEDALDVQRNGYGRDIYTIPDSVSEQINAWYRDKAYIFDNRAVIGDEYDGLIDVVIKAIKQYGIRLVFLDNLMTAIECEANTDIYRAQSEFVKKLEKLAKTYNVIVLLVAHPKKSNADFDNDTVSGSADITNAVDVVMCYQRAASGLDYDSTLLVTKNRLTGELILKDDAVKLSYIPSCKRVIQYGSDAKRKYLVTEATADTSDLPWED